MTETPSPIHRWVTWQAKSGVVSSRAMEHTWDARTLLTFYGIVQAQEPNGTLTIEAHFQGPVPLEPPIMVTLTLAQARAMTMCVIDTPTQDEAGQWTHPAPLDEGNT